MTTNPTFHMEGVIKAKDDMQDFEGPLILLLQLLSKNKIEIADIKISLILEQYLAYLEKMKRMDLEIASEFIQMAAHLVYIKTKTLLAGDEEIPEMELLLSSIEELRLRDTYLQIKETIPTLTEMAARGADFGVKSPEAIEPEEGYRYNHDMGTLLDAFRGILANEGAAMPLPGREFSIPNRISYPVTDKSEEIVSTLRRLGEIEIKRLFAESKSRSEVVATFIAVLELCRSGDVYIHTGGSGELLLRNTAEQEGNVGTV